MVRSVKEEYKFKVAFLSEVPFPIDICWIDFNGQEIAMREGLKTGEQHTDYTYFTHPWVFPKSPGGQRQIADTNGVQSEIFEGERYLAIPDEPITVIIVESKY